VTVKEWQRVGRCESFRVLMFRVRVYGLKLRI